MCAFCGDEFKPISKANVCCSVACSRRHSRRDKTATAEKVRKRCVICSAEFLPKRVIDVCCSSACSDKRARKATTREYDCEQCGEAFTWNKKGNRPVRCEACRNTGRRKVKNEEPCAFCGEQFTRTVGQPARFCSRACSSKGIHAEGQGHQYDTSDVLFRMVGYVKSAIHTPTYEDILDAVGVSDKWRLDRLPGLSVLDIFAKAGRKNKSRFPSLFEEMVYYALLGAGLDNEDLERQKTFPDLHTKSGRWPLRFDFFIERLNVLVEADGPQHVSKERQGRFDHKRTKASDMIKQDYADRNGLVLLRIPYSPVYRKVVLEVTKQVRPFLDA
jgi:very-short-patch-repair endonuclease